MKIGITTNNKIVYINSNKISFIEYDIKKDKTIIHFSENFKLRTNGKNVFEELIRYLESEKE